MATNLRELFGDDEQLLALLADYETNGEAAASADANAAQNLGTTGRERQTAQTGIGQGEQSAHLLLRAEFSDTELESRQTEEEARKAEMRQAEIAEEFRRYIEQGVPVPELPRPKRLEERDEALRMESIQDFRRQMEQSIPAPALPNTQRGHFYNPAPVGIPVRDFASQVPQKQKGKLASLLWNIVFFGSLIVFLGICVAFSLNPNPQKSILDYRVYNVLTESMLPVYDAGDMLIVRLVEPEAVAVGDVITFVPPGERDDVFLTHRVEKITVQQDGEIVFTTKGDANKDADPFTTTGERLIGRVILSIPKGGGLIRLMQENKVLSLLFLTAVFCFFLVLRWFLADRKRAKYIHNPVL